MPAPGHPRPPSRGDGFRPTRDALTSAGRIHKRADGPILLIGRIDVVDGAGVAEQLALLNYRPQSMNCGICWPVILLPSPPPLSSVYTFASRPLPPDIDTR